MLFIKTKSFNAFNDSSAHNHYESHKIRRLNQVANSDHCESNTKGGSRFNELLTREPESDSAKNRSDRGCEPLQKSDSKEQCVH